MRPRRIHVPRVRASGSLTAVRRASELDAATNGERFDVVVIGGGITGAGTALDAASRGLKTALIESRDLAFGTSRWSSKLAHGGLRYLASGDVGVAYESAVERGNLLRFIAPHLVRGTPMMLPLIEAVGSQRATLMGAGFVAGDLLRRAARTPSRELPGPRRVSAAGALALAPSLPTHGLRGGLVIHDGQLTDDARLVVGVARTAAAHGASVLTRVKATALEDGGVVVVDELTGEAGTIKTRAIVNATGVWAAGLAPELELRPSRGTHVVLSGDAMPGLRASLTLPYPGSRNRYLLVLPQLDGHVYLGLTDEAVEVIDDVPQPEQWEIDEMVGALGDVLGTPVDPAHVLGAYAGLRPLLAGTSGKADGEPEETSDLSREHTVVRGQHGAVHVVGGKLTTYRRMAEDAVDAAIDHVGLDAGPSQTRRLPLVGAAPRTQLSAMPDDPLMIARFGTESGLVSRWIREDAALGEPIAPGVPVTHADLRFAALHEAAFTAEDLLDRRFRVGFVAADRAAALPAAEAALADARALGDA